MCNDDSKKGAQKLGVKSFPKIPEIEVDEYVLPATHLGLGIENDVIAAYEDRVETKIVWVSVGDEVMRSRLAELDAEIQEKREAVKSVDEMPDIIVCAKLQ